MALTKLETCLTRCEFAALLSRSIGLRPPVAEFFGVPFRVAVNNSYHGCMTVARYCDPIL